MRAYRKREWASLGINMTPLIDVIFLIHIFSIMIMSYYEFLPKNVLLPTADEARPDTKMKECSITVTAEEDVLLGNQRVPLSELEWMVRERFPDPRGHTVELRGDENVTFAIIQEVMQKIAQAGVSRIHFATRTTHERDTTDETSDKSDD